MGIFLFVVCLNHHFLTLWIIDSALFCCEQCGLLGWWPIPYFLTFAKNLVFNPVSSAAPLGVSCSALKQHTSIHWFIFHGVCFHKYLSLAYIWVHVLVIDLHFPSNKVSACNFGFAADYTSCRFDFYLQVRGRNTADLILYCVMACSHVVFFAWLCVSPIFHCSLSCSLLVTCECLCLMQRFKLHAATSTFVLFGCWLLPLCVCNKILSLKFVRVPVWYRLHRCILPPSTVQWTSALCVDSNRSCPWWDECVDVCRAHVEQVGVDNELVWTMKKDSGSANWKGRVRSVCWMEIGRLRFKARVEMYTQARIMDLVWVKEGMPLQFVTKPNALIHSNKDECDSRSLLTNVRCASSDNWYIRLLFMRIIFFGATITFATSMQ